MKTNARWILFDNQSLQNLSDALAVLPAPTGAIERTATGINVKAASITEAMLTTAFKDLVAYLSQNETVTGSWTFSNVLTAATAPTSANHLTNKAYVDGIATGLDLKASVRAATIANITLSGLQTIDGIALSVGNRVLVKNQTTASQNGIYTAAVGAWARSTDADENAEVTSGLFTFVEEGTTNGGTGWTLTTPNPITVNTTALTFTQFSGASGLTAGAGLVQTGSAFDVVAANDSIVVTADAIRVGVDGTTIEVGAGVGIRVKANSISPTHITTAIAGAGLTGGNGTALSVVAAAFIRAGAVEIDGDQLDIDYAPTNYTPATGGIHNHVEHLSSHLKGIDNALGQAPKVRSELFTLSSTDATNRYVTLANVPAVANRVRLFVRGAPNQHYGADYGMDAVNTTRLTWSGLGLDGQLATGDQLTVAYDVT